MQNPAETVNPEERKDQAQSSESNVVAPGRQPPIPSHSTPPHTPAPREVGGPSGPEPTRFGDWERKGRCIDF